MRIVLLSDIHANVTALESVLADVKTIGAFDGFALLGDLINYGPRPNETIEIIKNLPSNKVLVNIWGNHEFSVFGGSPERFATDRGRSALQFTKSVLTEESKEYLYNYMDRNGFCQFRTKDCSILFMHGNPDDPFWGKFGAGDVNDERFSAYDYVISGHSHIPFYVEHFFPSEDTQYRNRKRTIFINPGSVGQPRNHNPYAQYAILDTESGNYEHRSIQYDIEKEQALFSDKIDVFYKERIKLGI